MASKWFGQCLWLIFGLLVFSCSDPPVDRQYLKSKDYSQFNQKQQSEYATRISSYQSLKKYLATFQQCGTGAPRSLPLQVDADLLQDVKHECTEISNVFKTDFETKIVGHSRSGDILIRWLLLKKKQTVYQDWEFLAATYKDEKLLSFQTLGTFRKNLSDDISTKIKITEEAAQIRITAYTNRGIQYPIKQENIIKFVFLINAEGMIENQPSEREYFRSLPKYLESLHECPKGKKRVPPFQMESNFLNNAGESCNQINDIYNTNFVARIIGYTPFNDFTIRWISLVRKSTSVERKIVAAIYQDHSLQNFKKVGAFRKGSEKKISTTIKAAFKDRKMHIRSLQTRHVKFPIQHKNVVQSKYTVSAEGQITRVQK